MWCTMGCIASLCNPTFVWKRLEKDSFKLWRALEYAALPIGYWPKTHSNEKPANLDSLWHDYKGYFSMVLLVICNPHYNITATDIGKYGSNNNCCVLLKFEQNRSNIFPPETLDGLDETVPFFLVGDEIFPPKVWLMRPFAGEQLTDKMRKVSNYMLSRARRITENTCGILASR